MRVAAIIPARGGSKRLPRKNLQDVGGRTLVAHAVDVARAAGCEAHVSTEDDLIAQVASAAGAIVRARPVRLASDHTSSEAVLVDWWRSLSADERPDVIVLLQPSTLIIDRSANHLAEALDLLETTQADSVVAVRLNTHAHFQGRSYPRDGWRQFRPFRPLDYRPRTQDVRDICEETGAFYCTRREAWEASGNRMSGVIAEYRMPQWSVVDIDTASDLEAARALWEASR